MEIHLPFGRGARLRDEIGRSRDRMCRIAYAWTHDAGLAEDLVQSAIERALRASGQLREDGSIRAWLLKILANCLRDHLRSRREHVDLESVEDVLASPGDTPEEAHARNELVRRVRGAVSRLPLGQRQVVTLVDLEELSYAQAGEILGVPVGTVMSRLCRARRALRELLDPAAAEAPGTRLRSVK